MTESLTLFSKRIEQKRVISVFNFFLILSVPCGTKDIKIVRQHILSATVKAMF